MSKLHFSSNISGIFVSLLCLTAAPAMAASPVTYVSGNGADSGTCATPANPCKTLQYAIDHTSPFGEVKALDAARYGSKMVITKSISVMGVEGASLSRASGDATVVINAGANDVINISGLIFDGMKGATNGLVFNSGGSLNISHSVFRNFVSDGILVQPTQGTAYFQISDVVATNNSGAGIDIYPKVTATVIGTVDRARLHRNGIGLQTYRNTNDTIARVTVHDSVASGNQNYGFLAASQGILQLSRSVSTSNNYGLFVNTGAVSAGDNFFANNATNDVAGGYGTIPLR